MMKFFTPSSKVLNLKSGKKTAPIALAFTGLIALAGLSNVNAQSHSYNNGNGYDRQMQMTGEADRQHKANVIEIASNHQGEGTSEVPKAAGTGNHSLDGVTVDWSYNNSEARMLVSFVNGVGKYEWIAGRRTGNSDENIPYSAREIAPDIFLMSWIQAERPDFITMIFDFNAMTIATTGLIGYGSDNERMLFMDGVINSVDR